MKTHRDIWCFFREWCVDVLVRYTWGPTKIEGSSKFYSISSPKYTPSTIKLRLAKPPAVSVPMETYLDGNLRQ
jgi:hypothetical protein